MKKHKPIARLLTDISFWSAVSGFFGALLLGLYGLPEMIHPDGSIYLALEQIDQSQILAAAQYDFLSKIGWVLVVVSFVLQIIERYISHSGFNKN